MATYRYAIEFFRKDGTTAGRAPAVPDLEPLREAAWFEALRADRIDPTADAGGLPVSPVWNRRAGAPYLQGLRVGTAVAGDATPAPGATTAEAAPIAGEFGLHLFADLAPLALDALVDQGTLTKDDTTYYLVTAYPVDQDVAEPAPRRLFTTRETTPPLPLTETPLDRFRPEMCAAGAVDPRDVPALIPAQILSEAAALSRDADGNETGGVLIGHVHRDPRTRELFVEVTAQIPALHTEAESSRLTFTAQTWTAVRAALDLRGRSELMLGWWHSHPVREWCKDCPEETREKCALSCDYFSAQDRALHRAVFPRAYSLALVVNDVCADEPTFSLFGWKDGRIEARGYHRLEPEPSAGDAAAQTAAQTVLTPGGDHVQ